MPCFLHWVLVLVVHVPDSVFIAMSGECRPVLVFSPHFPALIFAAQISPAHSPVPICAASFLSARVFGGSAEVSRFSLVSKAAGQICS
jgi:hypothetical protein